MTDAERQLAEDRATRESARAVFDARLARIRRALDERSIGRRINHEALSQAKAAAEQTAEIARDQRWIIAGTLVVLTGWFLHRPLIRWSGVLASRLKGKEPQSRWRRWQQWASERFDRD